MSADNSPLGAMVAALRSEKGSLKIVLTFTHGRCVQVYDGRKKIGPILIPGAGQTLADVLAMLGNLVEQQSQPDDASADFLRDDEPLPTPDEALRLGWTV